MADSATVSTPIVDGEVLMHEKEVHSLDRDPVRERAETAFERFGDEVGWEMDIGGSDPPSTVRTVRDLPKRGPAHLVARLGLQHVKDRL
jgi:5-methylthioadenosine/S-adenosylhomocysteine deaminase